MNDYNAISASLEAHHSGSGIAQSPQGALSRQIGVPIAYPLRTTLVADWMIAKKECGNFWEPKGEHATHAMRTPAHLKCIASGREHAAMAWQQACVKLSEHGLQMASAVNYAFDKADLVNMLSHFVLDDREHYHVLSWLGQNTRHDTALHRPWKLIGKSKLVHLYDPNMGEFHVNDQGLSEVLQAWLQAYHGSGSTCILQRFNG